MYKWDTSIFKKTKDTIKASKFSAFEETAVELQGRHTIVNEARWLLEPLSSDWISILVKQAHFGYVHVQIGRADASGQNFFHK